MNLKEDLQKRYEKTDLAIKRTMQDISIAEAVLEKHKTDLSELRSYEEELAHAIAILYGVETNEI